MGALLVVVGLQGLLYLWLLPPWQHYDEPGHFEHAWLIANRGRLAQPDDVDAELRRAVATSMVAHGFYRGMAAPDLDAAEPIRIGASQLHDPPAYYLLVSLPLRLVRHLDVTAQLYVARGVSLVLFALTALVCAAIVRDLTPPGHVLRWLVPLALVLLPPFADLMTAVNNEVGATLVFSVFLWGCVRTIRFGISARRLAWIVGAALLGVATKNTTLPALALVPVAVAIAFWTRRGWPWLAPVAAGVVALGVGGVLLFDWDDAAYWYRLSWAGELRPTRTVDPAAPFGPHALVVEAGAAGEERHLLNPVLERSLPGLAGQRVTVGGWVWANRPATVPAVGLIWRDAGSGELGLLADPVEVTTTPALVTRSYEVPAQAGQLFYALLAVSDGEADGSLRLSLDGAFLLVGEYPAGTVPAFDDGRVRSGVWAGRAFSNVVRNGAAEGAWPRLRPWAYHLLQRYIGGTDRLQVLAPLFDVEQSAAFLLGPVGRGLVRGLFGSFAWGHVRLRGAGWFALFEGLILLALGGCVWWWLGARARGFVRAALLFLALAGVLVWANTLVWPLAYSFWANARLPSVRYTFPAIIPTVLGLTGGLLALLPRRYRRAGAVALVIGLVVLDGVAVWTIWSFYRETLYLYLNEMKH